MKANTIWICNHCKEEYPYQPMFCNDCGVEFRANETFTYCNNKYKRLSNGEIIDLTEPLYMQYDGLNGYLVLSGSQIYHFYSIDNDIIKQCVTQYFEKIN